MANEDQRCDKCRHFFSTPDQPGQTGRGGCKRFPPQTHFIVVLRPRSQLTPHLLDPKEEQRSAFPAVMSDWGCGEFAPKIALTS